MIYSVYLPNLNITKFYLHIFIIIDLARSYLNQPTVKAHIVCLSRQAGVDAPKNNCSQAGTSQRCVIFH